MQWTSRAISACLTAMLWLNQPALAQTQDVPVGMNDILKVRATIWNAADGTVEELLTVSDSYSVSAGGKISVPLVGSVDVAGLTPQEIASTLQEAMAGYAGAGRTPRVSVDVEQYAMIYVAGEVDAPNVYTYSPGLTVLKAVTLAGGTARIEPILGQERNFYLARSAAMVLSKQLRFLEARRDRLAAEVARSEITAARDSPDLPSVSKFRAGEAAIFEARNQLLDQQLAFLDKAETALNDAIRVLEQKLATNTEQLRAGREELRREEDMVEQGLATRARLFDRVRYVGEVESRVLDIERSILSTQQNLRDIEEERIVLEASRAETAVTELQEVTAKIVEAEAKLDGEYALMSAALGEDVTLESLHARAVGTPEFWITRTREGDSRQFEAQSDTKILPGDVVEVKFPDILEEDFPETPAAFSAAGSVN
ncbi:polysaccharide biosynthesis/export family protein [Roseovarius sp.]|uniref:polysaccharide biosynthesis/export family protein n=1 Tax=Roseovarius sp. TaxID=1486281 RepID=UPI0025D0AA2D|nr:polysaccharide biosynthesis/export family protein [Roseovarius sp.]